MGIHGNMRRTSRQRRCLQWAGWLLVAAIWITEPLLMPSVAIYAAGELPQYFGPSSYMPFLPNNYCTGKRPKTVPFGTQVYGPVGYDSEYFNLLQETNSAWLRNAITWSSVEPSNVPPAEYRWEWVDSTLSSAKANCANLIVTIDGTPSWARLDGSIDGRTPFKAEYLPEFVEFVSALVERYDGDGSGDAPSGVRVDYWEFYNEPDFGSEVPGHEGWGEHGDRYAEMLAAIYQPVHQHNPNAKVVLGGLAYSLFVNDPNGGLHVRNFFADVLAAGGGAYFDVMNFHYYPFQYNRIVWTDTNASGLIEKYASLQAIMAAYHVEKPLIITELGAHSASTDEQYPSTPEYQARRVLELFTQSRSLGAETTIWWTFVDGSLTFPYRTGLVASGLEITARPSYVVYQQVISRLGSSEFVETIMQPTLQNDLEAYRFFDKQRNKTFYVAWLNPVAPLDNNALSSFQDDESQSLQVPGTTATIISKVGNHIATFDDGDDGNVDTLVTVPVGRSPIYIVID